MKTGRLIFALVLCCSTFALADEPAVESKMDWGGDVRLRSVYFNDIPYKGGTTARGSDNSFQRYRTRLWGELRATDSLTFNARLVNEFRTYQNASKTPGSSAWNSLDEIVFDHLYFDWSPAGDWTVRVGRQDLIYGTGKVILEGTAKDGSRTIYFDAIKASYTGLPDTTVDFLGMYTHGDDPLAMHSEDRDVVGKGPGQYAGAEAGGGVYLKNNSFEDYPFETYYLVKTKEESIGTHDDTDRHVLGMRIMPQLSDSVDANLEMASQFGEEIDAYMIDAQLNWHLSSEGAKPCLGMGWYHLSGDDPSTTKDEGWNPMWARWPQYSELYVYSYDTDGAGRWSNISMPHIDFSFHPTAKIQTSCLLGYMFAPEKDSVTDGRNRGLLATIWNRFTIKENLWTEGDKLAGHVLIEAMDPGDYYTQEQRHSTAFFGRVELNYSF